MVEYNTVNSKLSNSQLNKLKTAVKNNAGATLRISARMFNSDNLSHELLLTTRQTTKLRSAIENNMSTDDKLSKAQISKIGLTSASSAIDAAVQNKIYGSGTTTLVISNEETNDIMKIVKALED